MNLSKSLFVLLLATLAPLPVAFAQTTPSTTTATAALREAIQAKLPAGTTLETASATQLAAAVKATVESNPGAAAEVAAIAAAAQPGAAVEIVRAATEAGTAGQSNPAVRARIASAIVAEVADATAGATGAPSINDLKEAAAPAANLGVEDIATPEAPVTLEQIVPDPDYGTTEDATDRDIL